MDLSKAFDCVDHNILLAKLKRYGIHETALQWINSYLSDREHFVSWNQTHSPLLNLNIGVPQGSILRPLLFLININDIVNSSNILSFVLFADDTTVYVQHDSIYGAIQILTLELAKVAEWFDSNQLTLNVNKTQMLMMSRKKNLNPQGDVILRNNAIQRATKSKFLGVIIVDQHLNWKDHISMVSHKISKSCGMISRIRNTLDIKFKKMIYYSFIHPYLTYLSMSGPLHIELILKPYVQLKGGQCVHSLLLLSSPIREISSSIKKFCLWTN